MATSTTRRKRRRSPSRSKKKRSRIRLWRWLAVLVVIGCLLCLPVLFWLNSELGDKFDRHEWTIPAKVYARPLELYAGSTVNRKQLLSELELLGYQRGSGDTPGSYKLSPNKVQLHTRGFRFGDGVEAAQRANIQWQDSRVASLSAPGTELDLLRLEALQIGGIYPGHNEDRQLIALDQTPEGFLDCLLAVEDRSYYSHFGISLRGIARAMWVNLKQGEFTQGGSTITQQLVKNLFLNQDRTLSRKLAEMPMAIMLERRSSKEEILQMFLNEVFLVQDGNRAVHGFALASQYFFNQPLDELLPHQYALLVGMIKGPSYYNPLRNPERAMKRRNLVLQLMAQQGVMSQEEADYAAGLELDLSTKPSSKVRQPAYLDLVRRQLSEDYRLEDLQTEGLRVFTNFDPLIQLAAEKSVQSAFADIDKRPARTEVNSAQAVELEAAMLVSNSSTGEVLAIVGGRKARYAGFNRALDARRPIGSLIKPAIYLTALEQPDRYTLASFIDDERFELPQRDGSVWSPNNFDGESHGPVTLLEALSRSYNQASAGLGLALGIPEVHKTLRELGVERDIPELPAVFLGSLELSVMEVAAMYQTLASGGFNTPLRAIREILDASGEPIKHYGLDIEQRVSPDTMHLLQYAMQETMRNGTGRSAYQFIPENLSSAGKTGTSNGQRDSWFAGFTGDLLAVSWMGNDDYLQTSLTGSSGALRAWSYLFRDISRNPLVFKPPSGVQYAWTERGTGLRSAQHCDGADYIPYISGTEPLNEAECVRRTFPGQTKKRRDGAPQRNGNWLRQFFDLNKL